jgi:hypothetical protein
MEVIEPRFTHAGVELSAVVGSKCLTLQGKDTHGSFRVVLFPEELRPLVRGLLRGLSLLAPEDRQAWAASFLMVDLEIPEEGAA